MKHSRALCLLTVALLLGGCSGVVVRKYSTHGQDDPSSSEVASDAVVVARSQAVGAESDSLQLDGCGSPIDGVAGVDMAKALSAFQRANGLRVTGQLDMASSTALAR